MADIASPVNTSTQSLDAIVLPAGTVALKAGKGSETPSGVDDPIAQQVVVFDSGTATLANVSGAASSTTLIAANANRLGAAIVNDSSAILYVKLGSSASSTSYTVMLAGTVSSIAAYYEVPFGYTGIITGIWASATGNARVTELTA